MQDSTEDEEKHPVFKSPSSASSSSSRDRAATAPAETMVKGYSGDKPTESGDHSSPTHTSGGHCFECGVAFTSLLKRRVRTKKQQQKKQVVLCEVLFKNW